MTGHRGTPYQESVAHRFGVRCECGLTFEYGDTFPWTAGGKPSSRTIRNMRNAWQAYRLHWAEVLAARP